MHRPIATALIALVALLGASSSAFGGTQSGIDEYIEHVPSGGKDKPSEEFGKGGGKKLPGGVRDQLTSQGADGESAAALAESGTPSAGAGSGNGGTGAGSAQGPGGNGDGGAGNGGSGSGSGGDGVLGAADEDDDSWPGNLISGVFGSGSGGLGVGLPIGLGLVALVAGLALVARRRRASPS